MEAFGQPSQVGLLLPRRAKAQRAARHSCQGRHLEIRPLGLRLQYQS